MKKMLGIKRIALVLGFSLIVACLSACGSIDENEAMATSPKNGRIYECDYKTLRLHTEISTIVDGKEVVISGNMFPLFTDPLTVKDGEGNIIGYAGDAYGVIEQDDHGIYIGDQFDINMCGNFEFLGNSYELKNEEGVVVATATFNEFNTSGTIKDTNQNLVATYFSPFLANDYTVTIYENDICSDLSILMVVASYVSDYMADANN